MVRLHSLWELIRVGFKTSWRFFIVIFWDYLIWFGINYFFLELDVGWCLRFRVLLRVYATHKFLRYIRAFHLRTDLNPSPITIQWAIVRRHYLFEFTRRGRCWFRKLLHLQVLAIFDDRHEKNLVKCSSEFIRQLEFCNFLIKPYFVCEWNFIFRISGNPRMH